MCVDDLTLACMGTNSKAYSIKYDETAKQQEILVNLNCIFPFGCIHSSTLHLQAFARF